MGLVLQLHLMPPGCSCVPCRQAFWPAVWEGRKAQYEARHKKPQQAEPEEAAAAAARPQAQQRGKAGSKRAAAAATASADGGEREAAEPRRRSGRRRQRQPAAADTGPLPGTYGMFGVGRKAHLHRFVTGTKRKAGS